MKLQLVTNTGKVVVLAEAIEHYDLLSAMTQRTMWDRADRQIQAIIDEDRNERPSRGYDESRAVRPINRSRRSKGGRGKAKKS